MVRHVPGLGFFDGARQPYLALIRVARTPGWWPYVLVPTVILSALLGTALLSTTFWVRPMLDQALSNRTGIGWLDTALVWLGVLGSLVLGIFVALLFTTPLSAPALERLVALTEAELGRPPRPSIGFLAEMACGLRAQAAVLLWTFPAWLLLLALDMFAPYLAPLSLGLRALLTAFSVAWALVDYPLTLRGVAIRQRLALLRRALWPVFGFGAAFAALFWVPCCGILFLGVGVVAATQLVVALAAHDPAWSAALSFDSRRASE